MKLKFICPITDPGFEEESRNEAKRYASPSVQVDVERIPYGTESIECSLD